MIREDRWLIVLWPLLLPGALWIIIGCSMVALTRLAESWLED